MLPGPFDPDREDRHPDHKHLPDVDEPRNVFDEDDPLDDNAGDRQMNFFDDEEGLYELSFDDLRDMDGPDA